MHMAPGYPSSINASPTEDAESVNSEVDLPITGAEVAEVVRKLHGHRASQSPWRRKSSR